MQTLTGANTTRYFGYNVAAAASSGANGLFIDDAAPYPDGHEFSTGLVQTGSGAGGNVSATFTGATATSGTQAFSTNTWIKGATESNRTWNVLAGRASMLGGDTNSTSVGSVTINLGAVYTIGGH